MFLGTVKRRFWDLTGGQGEPCLVFRGSTCVLGPPSPQWVVEVRRTEVGRRKNEREVVLPREGRAPETCKGDILTRQNERRP